MQTMEVTGADYFIWLGKKPECQDEELQYDKNNCGNDLGRGSYVRFPLHEKINA